MDEHHNLFNMRIYVKQVKLTPTRLLNSTHNTLSRVVIHVPPKVACTTYTSIQNFDMCHVGPTQIKTQLFTLTFSLPSLLSRAKLFPLLSLSQQTHHHHRRV